jgi:succinyl-diaminopimelate desuccinylase
LLKKILNELISCKSVTPEDGGSIEFIQSFLIELGFSIERFDKNGVKNLYAYKKGGETNICFGGHVDVVPIIDGKKWFGDPFSLTEIDDIIYARGIVDMKGAIACYLSVIKELLESGEKAPSLSFIITSDEEGDAQYGTKHVVECLKKSGTKFDLCIIGEPTSVNKIGDILKIGRRGSFHAVINVNACGGHIAYPENFVNPITILTKALFSLKNTKLDEGDDVFQESNLEVHEINGGGVSSNVITYNAYAKLNIRFNDTWNEITLKDEINNRLKSALGDDIKYISMETSCNANAFRSSKSDHLDIFKHAAEELNNYESEFSTTGGTSDARFLKDLGPVIECGLKNESAHKINENSTWKDLESLKGIYKNVLKKFCY